MANEEKNVEKINGQSICFLKFGNQEVDRRSYRCGEELIQMAKGFAAQGSIQGPYHSSMHRNGKIHTMIWELS